MGFTIVEVHDDPAVPGAEKRGAGVKPIVFTQESIEAIEAGRKVMTRRVVKGLDGMNVYRVEPHWSYDEDEPLNGIAWDFVFGASGGGMCLDGAIPIKPRYLKGDLLWVKETWRLDDMNVEGDDWSASVVYKDGTVGGRVHGLHGSQTFSWRSPWFMPKAAARLFLMVEDVRPGRLQKISEADAIAEGITRMFDNLSDEEYARWASNTGETRQKSDWNWTNYLWHGFIGKSISKAQSDAWPYQYSGYSSAILSFSSLWESINGKREGGRYAWAKNPWVWAYTFKRVEAPEGWMAA